MVRGIVLDELADVVGDNLAVMCFLGFVGQVEAVLFGAVDDGVQRN